MTRRGLRRPASTVSSFLAAALVVVACAGTEVSPDPSVSAGASPTPVPTATARPVRVGVSTTTGATGWGDAMVCSIRAEAILAAGVELTVRDRRTDAAGQVEDLRNLAAVGAEVILVRPVDAAALTEVVGELVESGITVVSIGRPIDGADAVAVDQDAYGRLGADWLVQALGDKGKILRVTGPKDDPDQVARIAGFDAVLADHEDVTIAASIDSEGDPAVAVKALNSLLAEDPSFSGIWASGVDSVIVDALRMAERPLVPIVGGDGGAYVSQLLSTEGLEGAAVTDTPAVGGAALRLGLRAHAGDPPAAELQTLEPQRWDNLTDAGRAALTTANDPSIELGWPLDLSAPGWTEATVDDVVGCGKATNPS